MCTNTGFLSFINIILILSTISVAQDTWTDTKTHFQVGAGISTFGATVHLGFHYRPNHQGLNIRYLSSYTYRDAPFGSTNSGLDVSVEWGIGSRLTWSIHGFANLNQISSVAGVLTSFQWRLPRQ